MVVQAEAQNDHYTLQEHSDDEWDRYDGSYRNLVIEQEEKEPGATPLRTSPNIGPAAHVVAVYSSAPQGGCVSQPR